MTRYTLTEETKQAYGRTFVRMKWGGRLGGWIEQGASLPVNSRAVVFGDALIFARAASGLHGGVFRGGDFRGGEFWASPCMAQRSDGYCFMAKYVDGELRIWAGCRNFSWQEAQDHWGDRSHRHHEESMRIINFLKAQADAEAERDAKREAA